MNTKDRKPSSVQLPVWMHNAVKEMAITNRRSFARELEVLVEAALKNTGGDYLESAKKEPAQ